MKLCTNPTVHQSDSSDMSIITFCDCSSFEVCLSYRPLRSLIFGQNLTDYHYFFLADSETHYYQKSEHKIPYGAVCFGYGYATAPMKNHQTADETVQSVLLLFFVCN